MIKKITLRKLALISIIILIQGFLFAQKTYKYESVPGDLLNARIYTLDNGLKVYLTVYKDAPRIQTYVAVRVGSKNDPAETTGLAHYFEHMMFKGSTHFGTTDWEKEKPMVATIDALFEVYRNEKNEAKRAAIYHQIDSISYEASKIAIPNEYVKLMKVIGSQGTNAATSNDYTIYQEDIPSNQIENWAIIQADRFTNPVLRLFHTELETIYEEKNMSLTNDGRKSSEAMLKALFPNHPYGKQTTLGETEHLKNPSMKNVREFFAKYYVSNNMVVSMSGDFDPDEVIKVIDKNFSKLKPGNPPKLMFVQEEPIKTPIIKEVTGLDAENITIAWRFGGVATKDALMADMISMMLSNGKAGLIDLNINQKQKAMRSSAYSYGLVDYTALVLNGRPKTSQTLDEVKALLLEQVELLKKGEFQEWMLEAAINNLKLQELKRFESNNGRAMAMANSFLDGLSWEKSVKYIDELSKVTKKELIEFAKTNLADNYVVIYKRQGKPEEVTKIKKPAITPISINREGESDFVKDIKANPVKEIKPVFLDYTKDLTKFKAGNVNVLYKENTENKTFSLYYHFRMGSNNDKYMDVAISMLHYLGTSKMSAEEFKQAFYKLACNFSVSSSDEETYVTISGLSENMEKALGMMEDLLANVKPDQKAFDNYINDVLKGRKDAKLNQNRNFSALVDYATFGTKNSTTDILSEQELKSIKIEQLTNKIKDLFNYEHTVLYYGTEPVEKLKKLLVKYHKAPASFKPFSIPVKFKELETNTNIVYFAPYDSKQAQVQLLSKGGLYSLKLAADISLYNSYFGGGMNAIVFQEMREKRSLAYTARSTYQTPNDPLKPYLNVSYIATQNDKVIDALTAFNELFNTMPISETAFKLAKDAIISNINTQRTTKMGIIWNYLNAEKFGFTYDVRKDVYIKVATMTLQDVKNFNATYVKDKTKTYVILGKEADMDFNALEKFGTVKKLTQTDIFGY